MRELLFIFLIVVKLGVYSQECKSLFTFKATNEIVAFQNHSSYGDFYWNFGDGTSSKYKNPKHEFPGNGTYLVTLYVKINNCSDYYDQWISVTKSTNNCSPLIIDSIYASQFYPNMNEIKLIDNSFNCNGNNQQYFLGTSVGNGNTNVFFMPPYPANLVSYVEYSNSNRQRVGLRTVPYKYTRSKNYTGCSANFEFLVITEDNVSQTIYFKAMNRTAKSYKWYITGFGDPIIKNTDTIYFRFPYDPTYSGYRNTGSIILITEDQNRCKDSLLQTISIQRLSITTEGSEEINNEDLNLQPNPTIGKFTIESQNGIQLKSLSIINSLGQLVYELNNPEVKQEVDISFLADGIYYLSVQNAVSNKNFKLVKQ
jgi:PKD repeat protein